MRLGSLVDRKTMGGQALELQPAARDELQESLKVPLLRPANVIRWQVATALLVFSVVAAWPVRARQPQLELLSVQNLPSACTVTSPTTTRRPSVASEPSSELDGLRRPSARAQRRVRAARCTPL
jgi:hypothetical protein